jgi:hypothetical protein
MRRIDVGNSLGINGFLRAPINRGLGSVVRLRLEATVFVARLAVFGLLTS